MRLNGGEVKVSSGEMVSKSEKEVVKQFSRRVRRLQMFEPRIQVMQIQGYTQMSAL
jgi:phosphopantetheine adenylyltransferase